MGGGNARTVELFLTGGERAHQPPPHLLRRRLDLADGIEHFEDVPHDPLSLVDMCQFAAAEHDRNDDLVLVLEEALGLIDLEFDVVLARFRTQADFLDLGVVNVRLVLLLLLLILELAEVHDPADGRLLVGSHLHQIQTGFPREAECLLRGDDAELPAFGGDDPNRRDPNLLVYAVLLLYGSRLRTRTRSAGREEVELFAHATSGTPPGNCRQTARASGPRRIPEKAEYSSGQGVASRRWPFLRPPCRLSGMIPACARQEECTGPLSEGCADHPRRHPRELPWVAGAEDCLSGIPLEGPEKNR